MKYEPSLERREQAKQVLCACPALTPRELLAIAQALDEDPRGLRRYPIPSCIVVEDCTMFALRRSSICDEVRDVVASYRVFSQAYNGSPGFRDLDQERGTWSREMSPGHLLPYRTSRLAAFEQFLRDIAKELL